MKKIITIVLLLVTCSSMNVYAADNNNSYESIFNFLNKASEKTQEIYDNGKEYYHEKGYDKKVDDFLNKSKNVITDTKDSVKENFKEEGQKVKEFKDSVKEEQEEFYNNNPEKHEQKEEVKKEASNLSSSIKSFFKKIKTFLFE